MKNVISSQLYLQYLQLCWKIKTNTRIFCHHCVNISSTWFALLTFIHWIDKKHGRTISFSFHTKLAHPKNVLVLGKVGEIYNFEEIRQIYEFYSSYFCQNLFHFKICAYYGIELSPHCDIIFLINFRWTPETWKVS